MRVECLRYGKSLDDVGSPDFDWADAIAILSTAAPGSPLHDVLYPEAAGWTNENMLLADAVDALHVLAWQGAGGKKANKPKPIPRPGVGTDQKRKIGGKPIDIDEMKAILDARRRGRTAA